MSSRRNVYRTFVVVLWTGASAQSAEYRILSESVALPGSLASMRAEVETYAGDNLIGFGHFSFAVDLAFAGDAGVRGSAVRNIVMNVAVFDDVLSNQLGGPSEARYLGMGGVTTDVIWPNPGAGIGDIVELFTFDLLIPEAAQVGQTVTIMPSEGFLQNVVANDNFDPVAPQTFAAAHMTIVPEPGTLAFLFLGGLAFWRRAR